MTASILVRYSVSALHHWPGATGVRSYLASSHMHDFHIEAHAPVRHDDRDIEFHDLRDELGSAVQELLGQTPISERINLTVPDFGSRSCETIARQLLDALPQLTKVRVWEDDSCAAEVERQPLTPGIEGVVTLCGSTRFKDETIRVAQDFAAKGFIVLMVQFFGHADEIPLTEEEKAHLDQLHLRKIDISDFIYVVDPGGYVGESTKREIEYSKALGKPVLRMSEGHGPQTSWRGD